MKMKRMKQILSTLLAVAMLVTMAPAMTLAANRAEDNVDKEWYNFRNNPENNGVTDRPTPTETAETVQKWAKKYGTGWSAAPTPPLILNGKLYIGVKNQIVEVDQETGEELRRSDEMIGNVGYAMNPLTYADGKLFVQVGNGVIQAVDFETLQCVWYSEKIGGQTLCPISYAEIDGKGYLYSGTWAHESRDGSYFCVSTDDENVTPVEGVTKGGGKVKELTWQFIPSQDDSGLSESESKTRGFYWAGAYACEKYVAVGSDDGTPEGVYTTGAVFYTLDPLTGEIIDAIYGIAGDIRTTTVYDNGYLYFATKGGVLYKTKVDEDGYLSETSSIDLGAVTDEKVMATAAPIVYGDKIYMGVSGAGGQFDPDGGHGFRVIDNSGAFTQDSILYNIPIPGYPQTAALASTAHVNEDFDGDGQADGRVYIYFTYNAKPGGIYYCYDTAEQTESNPEQSGELFVPHTEQQNYCISTICADREGTLYYKNDSCYLMALERNPAYLNDMKVAGTKDEAISWDKAFDKSILDYTLKIPAAMKSAKITLDMNDGITASVNGAAYNGEAEVVLDEEDTKVEITVSKKEADQTYTRTYTVNFVRIKSISTLESMKVGNSNGFNGFAEMQPEFSPDVTEYTVDTSNAESFWRVWLKKTDVNSTITVVPEENVSKITTSAGNSTTQGHDRWNVYKIDNAKTAKVRIDVTAEDGEKTTSYYLSLEVPVKVTGITLDQTEAEIDVTDTLQLIAKVLPEDATIQTAKWYSSDEEVASVSETGLVTPKKAGNVTITVISDDGASITASCEVTVIDKAAEADALIQKIGDVTLESKADIDVARAAYDALNDVQKDRVTQLEVLEAAEVEYQRLADAAEKEEADKAAAASVDAKIEAIGEVTLESGDDIENARTAYEALTDDQKAKVEKLATLEAAEKAYEELCFAKAKEDAKNVLETYKELNDYREEQQNELAIILEDAKALIDVAEDKEAVEKIVAEAKEKMDQVKTDAELTAEEEKAAQEAAAREAAKAVDKKIEAIGEVTLESEAAIQEAREAYDELSDQAQSFVENYSVLEEAEAKLAELKKEAGEEGNEPSEPVEPENPDNSDKPDGSEDQTNDSSETGAPETGDNVSVAVIVIGMIAALGVVMLIVYKKRKDK